MDIGILGCFRRKKKTHIIEEFHETGLDIWDHFREEKIPFCSQMKYGTVMMLLFYFRVAVNNHHYISRDLGVKNPVHKHKLSLKAMDVVLFGPQKSKIKSKVWE